MKAGESESLASFMCLKYDAMQRLPECCSDLTCYFWSHTPGVKLLSGEQILFESPWLFATLNACLITSRFFDAIKTSCRKWKMRTIVTYTPLGFDGGINVRVLLAAIQFIFLPSPVDPLDCGYEGCNFLFEQYKYYKC